MPETGSNRNLLQGKIMVIGAHAGDAENMAGAAVLKHTRAGFSAFILHLTLGEAGHPSLPPAIYAEQRRQESLESARLMGAGVEWFDYPDGMLPVDETIKLRVCDVIRREKPAVILTHWKGSFHKDHVAAYEIVRDAIFYASLPAIQRSLPHHRVQAVYYPENWEDMEGWRADIYLDATEVWADYLAVLRSHEFIRGRPASPGFRYLEYYDALGTTRGCLGGFGKAVALMVPPGSWIKKVSLLPGIG
ncbi:MAG TPA: PIG-L family deacetylase [Anaerolineaceae bacterium]